MEYQTDYIDFIYINSIRQKKDASGSRFIAIADIKCGFKLSRIAELRLQWACELKREAY